jgi:ADP-heptose:LPS heptosyltransferase
MPKQKHILVIRLSAMGDVAISVPVLRAFIAQNPNVKLTVLTRPFFAVLFDGLPNVSIFEIDLKEKHKGVLGIFKLSKELKALGITEVADLHNVLRTNMLKFFFIGRTFKQIDKGRKEKKALVSGQIFMQLKSSSQRYADVFKALGFDLDMDCPTFPNPLDYPVNFPQDILQNARTIIGIAPFAQYESKMYPLDKMADVIKRLSQDYNVLLFGGGTKEKEQLELFEKNNVNVYNMAGQFTFKEELAIISNLKIMLSMDSGNGHLAALFGVKVATIWGNTHPYAGFVPFNQPIEHQLIPDQTDFPLIPTSIYGNKTPEKYKTVAGTIKPTTVFEKIISLI